MRALLPEQPQVRRGQVGVAERRRPRRPRSAGAPRPARPTSTRPARPRPTTADPARGRSTTPTVAVAVDRQTRSTSPTRACRGRSSSCRRSGRAPSHGRPARRSPPPSSPSTASVGPLGGDHFAQRLLGGGVGVGDGAAVGLASYPQVGGPEPGERDGVGGVGQPQREREIVGGGIAGEDDTLPHRPHPEHRRPGISCGRDNGPARRGRRRHRRAALAGVAARGLRGVGRRRRPGRAGARPRGRRGPAGARPRPARHGRPRGLPPDPARGARPPRPDAHRPHRRGRLRRRPRRGRRRLRRQALPPRRAPGQGPRPAAPAHAGDGRGRGRAHGAVRAARARRRRRGRPGQQGVRAAAGAAAARRARSSPARRSCARCGTTPT